MPQDIYDKILMLAKRRGFIYPSYEIYGGVAGFYDYGPLGTQLKNNIEKLWRHFYLLKDICIEINTPNITIYEVLKASGHVDEFTDLTVDCKKCKTSFKLEDIIPQDKNIDETIEKGNIKCPNCGEKLKDPYPVNLMFTTKIGIGNTRDAFLRPETAQGIFTDFHLLYRYAREKLPFGVIQIGRGYRNEVSPRQGIIRLREFNMAEAEIFFDPENKKHPYYKTVKDKEIKLFDNKKDMILTLEKSVQKNIVNNRFLAYYIYLTQELLISIGIDPEKLRFRKHQADEMAHYATECWDAEIYSKRFGWIECVGIADRSAYDINAHIKSSNTDMYAIRKYDKPQTKKVKKIIPKMDKLGPLFKNNAGKIKEKLESKPFDDNKVIQVDLNGEKIEIPSDCYEIKEIEETQTGEKFIPHVIEPSYGIDRILYCVMEHNYKEEDKKGDEYRVFTFKPAVAPLKTGVFPLINNDKLINIAKDVDKTLRNNGISTYYDEGGTIGRRYARMDEIGTPFCITVDHDTLEDKAVTVRDRDTTKQKRIKIEEISAYIMDKIK